MSKINYLSPVVARILAAGFAILSLYFFADNIHQLYKDYKNISNSVFLFGVMQGILFLFLSWFFWRQK